ncbi:MAG: T9SS type A sorting domain-containing protein [Ferruginibacter sp.]|nr:T9SS type A sorting domain-containing protein [Ferruginibacter sp.]
MKCKILLSAALLSTSFFSTAQVASKTYAITGKANNIFFWADIKQVDINKGKVDKTLFEAEKTPFATINQDKNTVASINTDNRPTGLGVAACALDTRNNRLYFATMHFSDIRFLDLSKEGANFTTVQKNVIATTSNNFHQSEENHITRMVIAADGYGYALSNDANHLIRFSTAKKPVVTDLGNLTDAETNKRISIHNKCSGWGGDMVADAFGKLVIISANHNVFTVDINSRIATLTGTISGLPANFTTNGAAVDDEGNLVVSSANVLEGLYKVNMKDMAATKVQSNEPAFNASDLANGNLLFQKEYNDIARYDLIKSRVLPAGNGETKVFPNPLTGAQFNVLFDNRPAGKYTIILTDISGRALQSQVVNISKSSQVETIRVTGKTSRGMYLVKVLSDKKQLAFSEKIVIN